MDRYELLFALCGSGLALAASGCGSSGNNASASTTDAAGDATTEGGSGEDSPVAPNDAPAADVQTPPDAMTGCTVFDASGLDEASVAAGFEQVWRTYRCWGCHQEASQKVDDAGQGIVLSGNNQGIGDSGTIFPPNLTNDPTGIGCWTNQAVEDAILKGTDPEGGTLCPSMPRWGHALATPDGGTRPGTPMDAGTAQEIIAYLRSLAPVANTVMDTTCPSADGGTDAADAGGGG
jgi:hypothetical protein